MDENNGHSEGPKTGRPELKSWLPPLVATWSQQVI